MDDLPDQDKEGITSVWSTFSAAPADQRRLMLEGIINSCCYSQIRLLYSRAKDLVGIDFTDVLPNEMSVNILRHLDTTSLCKAAQVSRRWRALADSDQVWFRMCEQHINQKCTKCGWGLPLLERKRLRSYKRQQQLGSISQQGSSRKRNTTGGDGGGDKTLSITPPCSDGSPPSTPAERTDEEIGVISDKTGKTHLTRPWKDVYRDRYKICLNWKHGRCSVNTFSGHTNGVLCLQFDDDVLMTGSYDTTVRIWDVNSGKVIRILKGHTSGIRCLQFTNTTLFTGSLDKTIRVWNWRTGECLKTLTGHLDGVISLHLDGDILVSGSIDKTIKIWHFQENKIFTLRGHDNWVNTVKIDAASRIVYSASDDLTIKMWDLDTHLPIKTLVGHAGFIQQLVLLPQEFDFSGNHEEHEDHDSDSSSTTLDSQATSPHVSQALLPLATHHASGSSYHPTDRPLPHRYLLSSALDSTIRLWDTVTGECVRKFFGHVEGVWALAADMLRMVSGSEDKCVKVWDLQSGRYERTYTGHAGPVTCIGLSDSKFCSGGEDGEVRMYSF